MKSQLHIRCSFDVVGFCESENAGFAIVAYQNW